MYNFKIENAQPRPMGVRRGSQSYLLRSGLASQKKPLRSPTRHDVAELSEPLIRPPRRTHRLLCHVPFLTCERRWTTAVERAVALE
jgi:hypothetical protein